MVPTKSLPKYALFCTNRYSIFAVPLFHGHWSSSGQRSIHECICSASPEVTREENSFSSSHTFRHEKLLQQPLSVTMRVSGDQPLLAKRRFSLFSHKISASFRKMSPDTKFCQPLFQRLLEHPPYLTSIDGQVEGKILKILQSRRYLNLVIWHRTRWWPQ